MSTKKIKALAIKSGSTPPGVEYEWKTIPSIQEFTKNITGFKPPAEDGGDGEKEKKPKKKKGGK